MAAGFFTKACSASPVRCRFRTSHGTNRYTGSDESCVASCLQQRGPQQMAGEELKQGNKGMLSWALTVFSCGPVVVWLSVNADQPSPCLS